MVVFGNAVATLSTRDLGLLEDFVKSLRVAPGGMHTQVHGGSRAIERFRGLCEGFARLARVYVGASLRERGGREGLGGGGVNGAGGDQSVSRKRDAEAAMLDSVDELMPDRGRGSGVDPVLFDPGDNWLLSGTFEDWMLGAAGSNQGLDFLGGDWPAYGTL